jgi:N-dimethylarginine dimethylaminohydrolase
MHKAEQEYFEIEEAYSHMESRLNIFKDTLIMIKKELFTKKQIIKIMSTNSSFKNGGHSSQKKFNPYSEDEYGG